MNALSFSPIAEKTPVTFISLNESKRLRNFVNPVLSAVLIFLT